MQGKSRFVLVAFCSVVGVTLQLVTPTTGQDADCFQDSGVFRATGRGIPSDAHKNPAQAEILAKRAAILDAQRRLAECLKGAHVKSNSQAGNLAIEEDKIKSEVEGLIRGARIVEEKTELVKGKDVAVVTLEVQSPKLINQGPANR